MTEKRKDRIREWRRNDKEGDRKTEWSLEEIRLMRIRNNG